MISKRKQENKTRTRKIKENNIIKKKPKQTRGRKEKEKERKGANNVEETNVRKQIQGKKPEGRRKNERILLEQI